MVGENTASGDDAAACTYIRDGLLNRRDTARTLTANIRSNCSIGRDSTLPEWDNRRY
jgi:hypothetical protein